jgi:biotin transport system substrate-specific component
VSSSFYKTDASAGTLADAVFAPLGWLRSLALVLGFSFITALAAQVFIPVPPVPFTGQTFAVLLTGALLGSRLGALAMIAYLVEGASGLPVFYGWSGGAHHFLGPTGGYLLSYPVAAFVAGFLAERGWDKRFLTAAAAMLIGSALILFIGWLWLLRFLPPVVALHEGVTKFIVGDIIKVALAAAVLPSGWMLLKSRKQ